MTTSWYDDNLEPELPATQVLRQPRDPEQLEFGHATSRGVFGFNSMDRRSRPFNLLRSQVLKLMQAHDWKVIGVTSATPGVGKTFVATNLAASMSRMPQMHTLLFDLDLRRGSIAEIFEIAEGPGINSYLSGEIDSLDAAAQEVVGTGLTIFPAFKGAYASSELLSNSRFKKLVSAMRGLRKNLVCICDLPPTFANDDAAIVAREIDAYILVVEEGKTTRQQIIDSIEMLRPAVCLGTVLNRYRAGVGEDDYGFGYGTSRSSSAYYSS